MTDSTIQEYNRQNGVDYTDMVNWNYSYHSNPYWNLTENANIDDRNRMLGSAQLQYKPLNWLTAMVRTGTDFYNQKRDYSVRSRAGSAATSATASPTATTRRAASAPRRTSSTRTTPTSS